MLAGFGARVNKFLRLGEAPATLHRRRELQLDHRYNGMLQILKNEPQILVL